MKKISLNIAGAFIYYDKLIKYIYKNNLHKKFNLMVYDSVDYCEWNGGRMNYKNNFTLEKVKAYNLLNISVGLSFSNYHINIKNKDGLNALNILQLSQNKYLKNKKNSIFLVNRYFLNFLKNNYNFNYKFSIIGHPDKLTDYPDIDFAINHYKKLEKEFDLIVPKRSHIDQKWFLENLKLNKYEVLFNYECWIDCPLFQTHFKIISDHNIKNKNKDKCWFKKDTNKIVKCDDEYLKFLIKLGYNHFKIAGRNTGFYEIKKDLRMFNDL